MEKVSKLEKQIIAEREKMRKELDGLRKHIIRLRLNEKGGKYLMQYKYRNIIENQDYKVTKDELCKIYMDIRSAEKLC